jgi:COP9 signalosome complex subunit 1
MNEPHTMIDDAAGIGSIDLDAYCANYHGNSLYARLLFIAQKFPNLSVQAYSLLSTALKASRNSKLYCDIFSNKTVSFGASFEFDKAWVDDTERRNHQRLERLEADFSAAKASMIKESIRIAYNDLGHFYSEVGNLQEALRAFTRTRDYTSMPRHAEEMTLSVCSLALHLRRTHLLANYLTKSAEDSASSPLVRDKLRALSALLCLSQQDFAGAARCFASVEGHLAGSFGEVLSGEDVALGAVLCGMAALERRELQALLLENPRFKPLLDLAPSPLRLLLGHFLAGRYAEVKAALAAGGWVRSRAELDLHLHPHVDKLFATLRDKLVLQYLQPYNAIRMSRAVDDLYPPADSAEERAAQEEALEAHAWRLIEGGQLGARIDAGCVEGSTLRRVQPEEKERALALQAVGGAASSSVARGQRAMLRLSLMKHSLALTRQQHPAAQFHMQQMYNVMGGGGAGAGAGGGAEEYAGLGRMEIDL